MEKLDRMKIAREAVLLGMKILNGTENAIKVSAKGLGDIVTDFDLEVEDAIRSHLTTADVGIPVRGEECGGHDGSGRSFWVIDPIDGTVNFSKQLPNFAVSVAFIEDGQPVAAAIGFPVSRTVFCAAQGEGAFQDDAPLRVSEVSDLSNAVVGFGDFSHGEGKKEVNTERHAVLSSLVDATLRIRMHGSAAYDLCMVARGSLDASVTLSNTSWDVSAGVLMVRESGGVVQDGDGSNHSVSSKFTIASNAKLSAVLPGRISNVTN